MKLVVGLDGLVSGKNAMAYAQKLAQLDDETEVIAVYVIEWSPFSFQTPEENAARHKRREEEIAVAQERVVEPAVKLITEAGLKARGIVRHGNAAEVLDVVAQEEGADQIIVARSSENGLSSRIFGSVTANLVMGASVPVTVVNR